MNTWPVCVCVCVCVVCGVVWCVSGVYVCVVCMSVGCVYVSGVGAVCLWCVCVCVICGGKHFSWQSILWGHSVLPYLAGLSLPAYL